MEPQEEFQNENDELLAVPVEEAPADEAPRRNTKKDLIAKIKSICEEHYPGYSLASNIFPRYWQTQKVNQVPNVTIARPRK